MKALVIKDLSMAEELDSKALAAVRGATKSQPHHSAEQQKASIKMLDLAGDYPAGSAWAVFFASAAEA